MEKTIKWNEGEGNIIVAYEGNGDGAVSFSSDVENIGIDREQNVIISTDKGEVSVSVLVKQPGLREVFYASDDIIYTFDGGTFNVLKCMGFNSKYTGDEIEETLDDLNDSDFVTIEAISEEEYADVFIIE